MNERRRIAALSLILLVGMSPIARSADPDPARVAAPLRAMIQLSEQTGKKFDTDAGQTRAAPLGFGVPTQDVDINSTINIAVSTDAFRKVLESHPAFLAQATMSSRTRALVEISATMQDAARRLDSAIVLATDLLALKAQGVSRLDSAFTATIVADQNEVGLMVQGYLAYLKFLADSPDEQVRRRHDRVFEKGDSILAMDDSVLKDRPLAMRSAFAALLNEEITWTIEMLENESGRVATSPTLALVLSASHLRDGVSVELGLPNYNDIPIGAPIPFDKLNLVPDAEQIAEMKRLNEEAKAWAAVLDSVQTSRKSLEEGLRDALRKADLDIAELESAVEVVLADLDTLARTNWGAATDSLIQKLSDAADAELVGPSLQRFNAEILPRVETLRDNVRALAGHVAKLREIIAVLKTFKISKDTEAMLATLSTAVGLTREIIDELPATLKDTVAVIKELVDESQRLVRDIRSMSENLALRFEAIVGNEVKARLGPLVENAEVLRDALDGFVDQIKPFGDPVQLLVASNIEPPSEAFFVPLDSVKDTYLDLKTVNPRRPDEMVTLRAWLYRVASQDDGTLVATEKSRLDFEEQNFRMMVMGWYNAPAVGVAYLRSANTLPGMDSPTGAFVPQMSWLFRHRSWRSYKLDADGAARHHGNYLDHVGIGFHTLAVDMNRDNQVEFGFGVTIGLYDDYILGGVGLNLTLDEELYYFVGAQLLGFGGGLGIANTPAPAPQ